MKVDMLLNYDNKPMNTDILSTFISKMIHLIYWWSLVDTTTAMTVDMGFKPNEAVHHTPLNLSTGEWPTDAF